MSEQMCPAKPSVLEVFQLQPQRRLADEYVLAANAACDEGGLALAWELLKMAEEAIRLSQRTRPERRQKREMDAVVEGYRRICLLRATQAQPTD